MGISGYCVDRWNGRFVASFLGMAAGTAVCYLFGTVWLAYQMTLGASASQSSFVQALPAAFAAGVLPFIIGDLAKMVITLLVGLKLDRFRGINVIRRCAEPLTWMY